MAAASDRRLQVIAFASAVVSTAAWVVFIASSGAPAPPPFDRAPERLAALQDLTPTYLTYGWAGTFGGLLTIPYLLGISYGLRARGPHIWLILILGVIGAFLTAAAFMGVSLSAVYFAMQVMDPAAATLEARLAALEIASKMLEAGWFLGSFLCYGLAIAWAAWEATRAGLGPKWLNRLGIVGGVAGLIWLRPFIPALQPLGFPGSVVNIVALSVWAIGLTWLLWRRSRA